MLFKRPVTHSEQLQTTEDDFQREDNGDYEPVVDDYDETDAEQPAQTPPQRPNPFPKKNFPGSPVIATATTTAPEPAPAPAPEQPAPAAASAPVTRQTETERRRDPKLIQMTLKIDRVLHGRVRYMTFKTGMSQSEIVEELIRMHCPVVP